jgi:spore coat-associated protein N
MSARMLSTRAKLLASTALLAAAAGAAGLGTFGSFTSTTSASEAVTSGTVNIAIGAAGGTDNRLTVGASNIVPGDTIQRAVKLTNSGNQALGAVTLTTAAAPSSLLDTDATNGLQMLVQKCTTAWVEANSPKYTYTCTGTTTTVVASQRVIGAAIPMTGLSSVTSGSDFLMVTLTLPATAGNTFQNLSSTLNFTFDATQRAAASQ